jgi:O-antigen/teichoic acid export membrane protein
LPVRKLSTDALLVFSGDAASRAIGFLATAHVARALGNESFGMTVIGFAFLSYVLWFADLGLGTLGTREMGRGDGRREYGLGDILSARMLLAAIVILPALAAALLLYHDEPLRTVVASYLFAVIPYGILLEWYFQGIQNYRPLILSRTLTAALYFALLQLFVLTPADVRLVPYIFAAANLIPALLLFSFKRRQDAIAPARFTLRGALRIIKGSSLIGIGGVFAQTVQLLPPLVLGYYSMSSAGTLGAALRIITVMLVIDRVFATLFLPAIARLWSEGAERVAPHLERVLALVIVTGFALATLITIYARSIMVIVFGASYASGAGALAITSWFAAATLINSVFTFGLIGAGKERAYLRATVMSGVVTCVVTAIMTALWQLTGAALAMVLSEICVASLTWWEFRRHVELRFARPLLVSILIAATLIAAAYALHLGGALLALLWGGPAVLLLFIGLALLLRGVRKADLIWLMER